MRIYHFSGGSHVKEDPQMNETEAVTLEQVVSLARQLSSLEKIRLIVRIAPEIERDLCPQKPLKSLLGAGYSREDIGGEN
jgi:hypothetical protein